MNIFIFLLLVILIFYIVLPLFKAGMTFRKIKKQINDSVRFQEKEMEEYYRHNRKAGWSKPDHATQKKIITKDMGEYVQFEEITEATYQECRKDDGKKFGRVKSEGRITDAKWEDL